MNSYCPQVALVARNYRLDEADVETGCKILAERLGCEGQPDMAVMEACGDALRLGGLPLIEKLARREDLLDVLSGSAAYRRATSVTRALSVDGSAAMARRIDEAAKLFSTYLWTALAGSPIPELMNAWPGSLLGQTYPSDRFAEVEGTNVWESAQAGLGIDVLQGEVIDIDFHRSLIVHTVVRLLPAAAQALRSSDEPGLWADATASIRESLSSDEARRLLELEQRATGLRLWDDRDVLAEPALDVGGLNCLLAFLLDCSLEIVGAYDDFRRNLGRAIPPALREKPYPQSYFALLQSGCSDEVDRIVARLDEGKSQRADRLRRWRDDFVRELRSGLLANVVVRVAPGMESKARTAIADLSASGYEFRLNDGVWRLRFDGGPRLTARRDSIGAWAIWHLLTREPGPVAVDDLDADVERSCPGRRQDREAMPEADVSGTGLERESGLPQADEGDIKDLHVEIAKLDGLAAQATKAGKRAVAEAYRKDANALRKHVASLVGLGGRPRATGGSTEKRSDRLRSAVRRLWESFEEPNSSAVRAIRDHFDTSLRFGGAVEYRAAPRPNWDVRSRP